MRSNKAAHSDARKSGARRWPLTLCDIQTEFVMNHKRKRSKQARAGCLLCKPNKLGKDLENKLGHRGFGKLRKERAARQDLDDAT